LLEASDELGGRARRLPLELAGHWHMLDNGQHLLLGAYSETAALFERLNVAFDTVVDRIRFVLV
jgi:predicted NAD/FAD-binding protein